VVQAQFDGPPPSYEHDPRSCAPSTMTGVAKGRLDEVDGEQAHDGRQR